MTDNKNANSIEDYLPELSPVFLEYLAQMAVDMQEPDELWQAVRATMDNLRAATLTIYEADKSKQWTYNRTIKAPPNSRLHIGEGSYEVAHDEYPQPKQSVDQQEHRPQHRLNRGDSKS